MINVAIVDDHSVVINGLQHMLQHFDTINIVGVYENGKSLLEGLKTIKPDVLLLDIQLPDINGNDLTVIIKKEYPSIRILAMTGFDMTYYVKTIMHKGATGYLLKNTTEKILVEAIETLYAGEQYIDPSLREQLLQDLLNNRKSTVQNPTLTRREKDVLKLIVEENTNQEIAKKLFLSLRTIEHYRTNLMQKLDVKNTAGLVKIAIQMGLMN